MKENIQILEHRMKAELRLTKRKFELEAETRSTYSKLPGYELHNVKRLD